MVKKKRPQEFFIGERVFNVSKGKSGRGDCYGICYLPKEFIGKKITLVVLKEKDYQLLEVVKREYSLKKKKNIQVKGGKKK